MDKHVYHQEFIIQRGSVQCPYALYKHTVQSYDATFPYTLVYSQIKLSPGKYTKKMSVNKHQLKAAYFKLMHLWKCSQNQWRHCKIVLFCINALDLWRPWTMQGYLSTGKFFREELKYKDLLFLQTGNDDDSHTSYGQSFNWKLAFASLLMKAWAASFTVELLCGPCLHAPSKQDQSHFTTLRFNLYAH